MGRKLKSVVRIVCPAAAGFGMWLGVPGAEASFQLQWHEGSNLNGYTAWVLTELNDGTAGPQQPHGAPTGTGLVAMDVILNTPGSFTDPAGTMFIDLNADIDSDGAADADVTGQPDDTFGTVRPSFGSTTGTFIGIGTAPRRDRTWLRSSRICRRRWRRRTAW